jgi:hypothetical protein
MSDIVTFKAPEVDKKIIEKISNTENKYVAKEFKTIQEVSKDHFYEFVNGEKIYTTVKNVKLTNETISIASLSEGIYILAIETIDGKKYTERFVKKN